MSTVLYSHMSAVQSHVITVWGYMHMYQSLKLLVQQTYSCMSAVQASSNFGTCACNPKLRLLKGKTVLSKPLIKVFKYRIVPVVV